MRTNNKLNPHATPGPGIEPGPRRWEASSLTTTPSLLPMYLHAQTNKMVPVANSLSIEELPEVVTSQNNVEYHVNYNKFYQRRIDRSFCGDGPFLLTEAGFD